LYLPLKTGTNKLWIEFSEKFPVMGWGLQARFVGYQRNFVVSKIIVVREIISG